ncbi:hypothetical protein F511_28178 [Dorcoceras hygrometricum]|uniref:Uncharacterized protein n=1 Tax=Dorcoceras hygrometricum TaxID=472368 RepID=A0A2Z7BJH1_9LAMI|nr:hypothetical protein F511_28178 [Dorcoceras hygrometricum]
MDFKSLKWQLLRGPLVRLLVLRAFMLVLAVIILSLMQMAREYRVIEPIVSDVNECTLNLHSNPFVNAGDFSNFSFYPSRDHETMCKESKNLTKIVFKELMQKNLLQSNDRALCVGEGSASSVSVLHELGFTDALGVNKHPFFSLFKRRFVYELNFEDGHFDFVYSGDLDKVSVPALLVLEIERVLKPGGIGAMLVGARNFYSGGLVRSATTVVSFLKSSDVVHVCGVGSFTLVIFKKKIGRFDSFEHFQLPADCPSIAKNKPFMKYIEPLAYKNSRQFNLEQYYLPNFMNISSRNKLLYINVGAGEFAKSSIAKMSRPYCGNHHAAFDVFVIDHKMSVLSSFVTDPGTTFVYHPALTGGSVAPEITPDEHLSAPMDEKGFDFVPWFNETVSDGDFVVLMMNTKFMELNILVELLKTGAICRIDELFLHCADPADCKTTVCGDCRDLLKSLRKSGVYAHAWLGD